MNPREQALVDALDRIDAAERTLANEWELDLDEFRAAIEDKRRAKADYDAAIRDMRAQANPA